MDHLLTEPCDSRNSDSLAEKCYYNNLKTNKQPPFAYWWEDSEICMLTPNIKKVSREEREFMNLISKRDTDSSLLVQSCF